MEHWRQILDYIPFIAAGTQAKTPTVTRLVEAAIIDAVSGSLDGHWEVPMTCKIRTS